MRRSIAAALVLALAAAVARAEDPAPLGPQTRDYDQLHLDLRVTLDMGEGSLRGEARHRLRALADGLSAVRMHLEDMQVESATTGDGGACTVAHEKDVVTFTLDRPRAADEEFVLVIRYGGTPRSGLWFFRPTEAHPDIPLQVWSQGQGTENRHWFPCYDLPDDRLTTHLEVDVPAGLTTLSNGEPVFRRESAPGREVHGWELAREHTTYLVTLVAGTFDHVEEDLGGVPHHLYVAPGWAEHVGEVFGRTGDMMAFFQDYTGQPYPWGRYSQVTVWDFMWGGMENTSATTLNMRALHGPGVRPDYTADGLVAHELAHMWFGDLVTCRTFDHIWLNEGFATYFTDLWVEHHEGADAFDVARLRSRDAYMDAVDLAALSVKPRPDEPTDCGDVKDHPYVKGSSVLHMLRHLVGADGFRDGVRLYVSRCAGRSVESEELRAAMEEVSGEDLRWFFDQWVHGTGHPVIHVTATWEPSGDGEGGDLVLRLRQSQAATPEMPHFRTPVDVEVVWDGDRTEVRREMLAGAAAEWRFPGPAQPRRWRVDPGTWLLGRVQPVLTRPEWELQLAEDSRVTGRILAARALGGMDAEGAAALSKAATSDASHDVRAEALAALGELRARAGLPALLAAADDEDSRVRTAAFEAMGAMPAEWVRARLMTGLRDETSHYAAAAAAASIGKACAGTPASAGDGADTPFGALVAALERDSHRDVIRREVMNGLAALGDPRGAAVALPYTDYAWGKGIQHRLRHAALDALVKLDPHGAATRARVVRLIDDPYFRMRTWAAGHAADLGIEEAIPVLERALPGAVGPGVKDAFEKALARLRPDR